MLPAGAIGTRDPYALYNLSAPNNHFALHHHFALQIYHARRQLPAGYAHHTKSAKHISRLILNSAMVKKIGYAALTAILLACLAGAAPTRLQAQETEEGEELAARIEVLEKDQEELRAELLLLTDRLDAIAGKDSGERVYSIPSNDSPVKGNPDARLTLVVFGDYQSGYTARSQAVVDRLLTEFADQIKFIFKHLPLTDRHPQANQAALSAIAASRQDRFWEMHERLIRYSRRLESDVYLLLATEIGLDVVQFQSDRNSLWALDRLSADEKLAAGLGVDSVPSFFLNGRRMLTWRYDYLKAKIERLLN